MNNNIIRNILTLTIIVSFFVCYITPIDARIIHKNDFINKFTKIDVDNSLDEKILSYMKGGHMPSLSACIIKNGSLVWSNSYGFSNLRTNKKTTENTIYLAGSISKTVTGTALMQLYEKDKFDLDDDVNEYLPFKLRNPKYPNINITFRMLLAHQSGIKDRPAMTFLFFSFLNHSKYLLKEYLVPEGKLYNSNIWMDSAPGEGKYYSSIGFEILGYLIEILSGESYAKYCKNNIFEPLEMNDSSFDIDDLDKSRLATPYMHYLSYLPLPDYEMDNACASAGGLRSTILDLSKFFIAHINSGVYDDVRILTEDSVNLMHSIQYLDKGGRDGLGWKIWRYDKENSSNLLEGHIGEVPGGTAFMYYRDNEKTGVLFFINQFGMRIKIIDFINCMGISETLFEKAKEL